MATVLYMWVTEHDITYVAKAIYTYNIHKYVVGYNKRNNVKILPYTCINTIPHEFTACYFIPQILCTYLTSPYHNINIYTTARTQTII